MGETCLPSELRTLFLFEDLSEEQLDKLCAHGHIAQFEPGPIVAEGDPATCFYVLIDGEVVMSKRSGGADIETTRTSQRGVYCGAWSAFVDGVPQLYESSVRVTVPSRFFVLDAAEFGIAGDESPADLEANAALAAEVEWLSTRLQRGVDVQAEDQAILDGLYRYHTMMLRKEIRRLVDVAMENGRAKVAKLAGKGDAHEPVAS